jgi:hypothetical protein
LNVRECPVTFATMNFWMSFFAWLAIATVLGLGLLWASYGTYWLLIVSLIGFIYAIARIGCATDH